MSFSFWLACRYAFAVTKGRFIGFISAVSVIGIALGVMVLITVMSVMNGFREEIQQRVLDLSPHVTLYAPPDAPIPKAMTQDPACKATSAFVEFQGMLKSPYRVSGALLKGIDAAHIDGIFPLSTHLNAGTIADFARKRFQIILGAQLATSLGVNVGDKVWLMVPVMQTSIAGATPRMRQFTVSGIFEVGYNFDQGVGFVSIEDARSLVGLEGTSGYWLKLADPFGAPNFVAHHLNVVPEGGYMSDWTVQNRNYFEAVKVEKTMMFFILTLIIAIAAFNLVSSLVMVVTDKKSDIAILSTMGAKPRQIWAIFVRQGMILGVIGTLVGTVAGILLSLNVTAVVHGIETLMGRRLLSADVYYIDYLPASLHAEDVIFIAVVSVVLAFFATLYPAKRATAILPAEALHHGH